MNELQYDDVIRLRKLLHGAHYVDVQVRKNGQDHHFECDFLKEVLDFFVDKNIERLANNKPTPSQDGGGG